MNKKLISEALGEISDKHIKEAIAYKKSSRLKTAIAIIAAAVVLIVGLFVVADREKGAQKLDLQMDESVSIYINTDDLMAMSPDMDIQIEWYDTDEISGEVKESFKDRVGVEPEAFISRLPEGFEVESFWSYLSRYNENGIRHETYSPYDYRMQIAAPTEGSITIAACGKGEPLRDCIIVCENAVPSMVNDTEMYIYKLGNSYYTCFESGGIYYDIETESVSDEEFAALIAALTAEPEK